MNTSKEDYELVKLKFFELQNELEIKNQQIYNCKNQLSRFTVLEEDYLQEIKVIQSSSKVKELQTEIKQLEGNIAQLHNDYEPELLKKQELVEKLRNQLQSLKRDKDKKLEANNGDHSNTYNLKDEILKLKNSLIEIEPNINCIKDQNSDLEKCIKGLRSQVNAAKEKLKCRIAEISEVDKMVVNLRDNVCEAKLELESFKNKPLDANKKGNSLFSEVEDSRLKIQRCIVQQKNLYSQMKNDLCKKLKQINNIRLENNELIQHINNMNISTVEYDTNVESYRTTIADLEKVIMDYKNEMLADETNAVQLVDNKVKYVKMVLKRIRNDTVKIRTELDNELKRKLNTFLEILSTNVEKRKLKLELLLKKIKIEELQNTISNIPLEDEELNNLMGVTDQKLVKIDVQLENTDLSCNDSLPKTEIKLETLETVKKINTIEESSQYEEKSDTKEFSRHLDDVESQKNIPEMTSEEEMKCKEEECDGEPIKSVNLHESLKNNSIASVNQRDLSIITEIEEQADSSKYCNITSAEMDRSNSITYITSAENSIVSGDHDEIQSETQQCIVIKNKTQEKDVSVVKEDQEVDLNDEVISEEEQLNNDIIDVNYSLLLPKHTPSIKNAFNLESDYNPNNPEFKQLKNISQESTVQFEESECLSATIQGGILDVCSDLKVSVNDKETPQIEKTVERLSLINEDKSMMVEQQKKSRFQTPSKIPLAMKSSAKKIRPLSHFERN